MKKTTLFLLMLGLITAFTLSSCKKDEKDGQYKEIDNWIGSKMDTYYLWTKKISSDQLDQNGQDTPEDYFKSLLYSTEDHWSYITGNYSSLMADLQGTPVSMGYAPLFGQFTGTDMVFIIVAYVYENTPAYNAGLKRGDIILKINGTQLTTSNIESLYNKETQTLGLGVYVEASNTINETSTTLSMTAELINVNPVIHSEVISKGGKTIGYIAISEFIDSATFVSNVGDSLNKLASEGVDELIVDLRYNMGGYISSAVWLASALAPATEVEQHGYFINVDYNDNLQAEAEQFNFDHYNFVSPGLNLNLTKIYFLTGRNTASASELVISGLKPFMDVTTIGEKTHGKYVGSTVFSAAADKVNSNYAIMPIILEYANMDGGSVKGGIAPDVELEDNMVAAVPFGDQTDPFLNQALFMITGISKSGVKSADNYPKIDRFLSDKQKLKMNLIVN